MERLTILPYPVGVMNERLFTQKRKFDAHLQCAQFSRYEVYTLQARQRLFGTVLAEVGDSDLPRNDQE